MIRARFRQIAKNLRRPYEVYNRIEVSRGALLHNFDFFRSATDKQIIPVLKANAYGHGTEQVTTALKARTFPYIAVDGYFEALRIRAVSRQPVLIMGMIKPSNFPSLRPRNFTFVVQDEPTLQALGRLKKKLKVHLEINTGMNRGGVAASDIKHFANLLQKYPRLHLEGVMTHLADADGKHQATVDQAVRNFDASVDIILASGHRPTLFHVGQSAGSLRVVSRYANAVRIGIGLYGINPFPKNHPLYHKCQTLQPALKLISTISKINQLEKGDQVSYNYTFTALKPMRIGVLPLGYHEGVNRALSNAGSVKFGRRFLPVVGRVCMNHTLVSLAGTNASVGDEVMVYSSGIQDENSIQAVQARHGLFSYNMLTDLSPDIRRYLIA